MLTSNVSHIEFPFIIVEDKIDSSFSSSYEYPVTWPTTLLLSCYSCTFPFIQLLWSLVLYFMHSSSFRLENSFSL